MKKDRLSRAKMVRSGPKTRGGFRKRGGLSILPSRSTTECEPSTSWDTSLLLTEDTSCDAIAIQPSGIEELGLEPTEMMTDITVDDYVLVSYLDKLFPGKVKEIQLNVDSPNTYKVSCMSRKGKCWVWPDKPDELFYDREDIVKKIDENAIQLINKRGMIQVKDVLLFSEEEYEMY